MLDYFDEKIDAIWMAITNTFIFLINLIPSPDFIEDVATTIDLVVAEVSYPAYLSGIDAGLPMLMSAYLIRFTIRRLPFIG